MSRTAVVLFNLGGPDSPKAVEPFLFNLFNDPAIIGAPAPVRYVLAKLISKRRAPIAREIYENLGGGSPLLENTQAQANALELLLGDETKCFIAMRYWHPMTGSVIESVKSWAPDTVVLLPLYPQFSTTTSGSSIGAWKKLARKMGLRAKSRTICCYPALGGFVATVANQISAAVPAGKVLGDYRVLFSAHGLPKKIIAKGDPYQWQVEQTVAAVAKDLETDDIPLDYAICYQSRVGPLEWIGPDLDTELARAAEDKRPVMVVPIAFVSEHSETLVELDIEYRKIAKDLGVRDYVRVPTVDLAVAFVEGLAGLVRNALVSEKVMLSGAGGRICPGVCVACPMPKTRK